MWEYMVKMKREKNVDLIVGSNEDGFQRANEENYAYIGESLTLEYATTRKENSNLTTYGGLLNSVGFGIGLKKNSPYLDELSLAILGEFGISLESASFFFNNYSIKSMWS